MGDLDMASENWEWPADGVPARSPYYAPNRIETKEPRAPDPQPKLLKTAAAPAPASGSGAAEAAEAAGAIPAAAPTAHITDYAWADDGLDVRVYLTVPGVRKDRVTCAFRDEGVDFRAEGLPDGTTRLLTLRQLYDRIDAPECTCKVLESKGKVVLTLAKPPRASANDTIREWPTLHFGSGADRARVEEWTVRNSQKSYDDMMMGMPKLPSEPGTTRRR